MEPERPLARFWHADRLEPPEKMSDLLQLALDDVAAAEAQPEKFRVRMNFSWLEIRDDDFCTVCAAGAVMCRSINLPPWALDTEYYPHEAPGDWPGALYALDHLRRGDIEEAYIARLQVRPGCGTVGNRRPKGLPFAWDVVDYGRDPAWWRENMTAMLAAIRAAEDNAELPQ